MDIQGSRRTHIIVYLNRYAGDISNLLNHKFNTLSSFGLKDEDVKGFVDKLNSVSKMNNKDLANIYECDIKWESNSIDS